jgi:hypothetical protein
MIAPPHNFLLVIIACAWVLKSLTSESADSVDIEKLKNLIYQKADLFYVVSELQKKVDLAESANLDIGKDALSIVIGRNNDNIKIQEILRIKKRKISFGKYSIFIENNVLFFQEAGFPKMSVVFLREKLEDIENRLTLNSRDISNLSSSVTSGYYPKSVVYTKSEVNGFLVQKISNEDAMDIIHDEVRRNTSDFYTIRESELAFMSRVEIDQLLLSKDLGNSLYHGKDDVYTKDESLLLFKQKGNDEDEEYIENQIRDAFTLNTYKDSAIYESKSHVAQNFYDKDFIDGNFYDKDFMNNKFYDKNFIENNFYDKFFIENNFYSKTLVENNFYDKNFINNNFYNKVFINNNFYTKALSDNKFYDKNFIDNNFYDKTESDAIESSLRSQLLTKMTEENGDLYIHADLIPSSNELYDLGSSSNKFRDLYLSGSTINLGSQTISSDSEGIKVRSLILGQSEGEKIQLKISTSEQTNKPSLKILTTIDEIEEDVIIENEQLAFLKNSVENLESSATSLENRLSIAETAIVSNETTVLNNRVRAVELDILAKNEFVNDRIDDVDSILGARIGVAENTIAADKATLEIYLGNLSGVVSSNKTDIETSLGNLSEIVSENKTDIEESLGNLSGVVSQNKSDIETSLQTLSGVVSVNKANLEISLDTLSDVVSENKSNIETSLQTLSGVVSQNKSDIETSLQTLSGVVSVNKANLEISLDTLTDVVSQNKSDIETSLQTLSGVVSQNKSDIETSVDNLIGVVSVNKTNLEISLDTLTDVVSENKSNIETSLQTLSGVVSVNKTNLEISLDTLTDVVSENKSNIETSLQTLSGVVSQNKSDIETSLQTLSGVVSVNKTNLEISLDTLTDVVSLNKSDIETSLQTLSGVVSQNKSEINQSLNQVVNDTNARLLNLEDRDQIYTSLVVAGSETTSSSISQDPGSLFVESEIVSGGPLVVWDDTQSGFDSTSGSFSGSIVTDGGIGVAKDVRCGGTVVSSNIEKIERQTKDISDDDQVSELSVFPNSSSLAGTEMQGRLGFSIMYEVGTYEVSSTFSPTTGIYYVMLVDSVSYSRSSAPILVSNSIFTTIFYEGVVGNSNAEFLTTSTANKVSFSIKKRGAYALYVKNIAPTTLFPSGTYVADATNTSKYPLTYGTFSGGVYSNLVSSFPINLYHTNGTKYVKFSDLGGDGDYIIKTYYKSWNYEPNLSESMFIQIKNNQTFASHMTIQDGMYPSISYSVTNRHITVTPGASVPLTFESESYNSSNYYIDFIKLNASNGFKYTFTPGATSGSVGVLDTNNISITRSSLTIRCVPDNPGSNTENGEYMYILNESFLTFDRYKNGIRDDDISVISKSYTVNISDPFDIKSYRIKIRNIFRNRLNIDGHLSVASTIHVPTIDANNIGATTLSATKLSATTTSSISQEPGSLFVEREIVSGGPLVVWDDTQSGFDSTSGSFSGSIVTDGGIGVAKDVRCGGTVVSSNIEKIERQTIDISDDDQASELSVFPNSSSLAGTEMEGRLSFNITYEVGTYEVSSTFSPTTGIYYVMLVDSVSYSRSSAPILVSNSIFTTIFYEGVVGNSNAEFLTTSTANKVSFSIKKRGTYALYVKNIVPVTLFPSGTYVANATNTSKYPLTYGTFSGGVYSNLASSFPINLYHTNGTKYVKFSDLGGDGDYIIKTYYKSWNYDPNLSESMFIQIKDNQTFTSHMTIQNGMHPVISYSNSNKHITITPGSSVPLTFQTESYNSNNYYIDFIKLNASNGFNYTFTPGATSGSAGVFNANNISITRSSLTLRCVPDNPGSNTENGEYMYILNESFLTFDRYKNGIRDDDISVISKSYTVDINNPFDIKSYRIKIRNIFRNRLNIDGHLSVASTIHVPTIDANNVDATTLSATTLSATTLSATTLSATTLSATTLSATTLNATLDVIAGRNMSCDSIWIKSINSGSADPISFPNPIKMNDNVRIKLGNTGEIFGLTNIIYIDSNSVNFRGNVGTGSGAITSGAITSNGIVMTYSYFQLRDPNNSAWSGEISRSVSNTGMKFNINNGGTSGFEFCKDGGRISSINYQGVYSTPSDDRLKENEEYITNGLDTIKKIKPEIYDKKNSMDSTDATKWGKESGVIAQQIWYDVPELRHLVELGDDASPSGSVSIPEDPTQDPDYTALGWGSTAASVNYSGFIPYLIEAVKELSHKNDELNAQLLERLARIETSMQEISRENVKLKTQNVNLSERLSYIESIINR